MTSHLSKLAAFGLLALLTWSLVLGWWQAVDYRPAGTETLLYLLVLPTALFGGFWLLRGFVQFLRAPARSGTPQAAPAHPVADPPATAQPAPRCRLAAVSLISAAGRRGAEICAAAAAGQRPAPDAQHLDDAGFPLYTARVAALPAHPSPPDIAVPALAAADEELVRALALLDAALAGVTPQLGAGQGAGRAGQGPAVLWLQPATWPTTLAPALRDWLRTRLPADWPDAATAVTVRTVHDEVDGLAAVVAAAQELSAAAGPDRCLVLGAVSHLGPGTLRRWAAGGRLFTAERQHGSIPGEAAFAALLAAATPTAAGNASLLTLHEPARGSRTAPPPAAGRVDTTALAALLAQSLDTAKLPAERLGGIVADTDQRAGHLQELLMAATDHCSGLDPMADCPAIGGCCGTLEPLGGALALLVAMEAASHSAQPMLCVSNQHPLERGVALVAPRADPTPQTRPPLPTPSPS